MKQNNVIECSDMIMSAMLGFEKELVNDNKSISSAWKKIITSISGNGQNIYEHSSVVEIKNHILLVEADHPGWIQMLQGNKNYILKGLSMYAKELEIRTLAFRLKGSNATLHQVDYGKQIKSAIELEKKNEEKIDEELKKYEKKDETVKGQLPDDLFEKFESLKTSVLTNNKK